MLTVAFDGIAYGMLLFILAVGLCVTLGLMNFVNLAHGAFAMGGAYLTVVMMNRFGLSFYLCLIAAPVAMGCVGVLLERTLYARLYDRTHLDQVLFSIGLIFMASAAVDYLMGANQQIVNLPASLDGRWRILGADVGVYRLFVIALCALIALALQLALKRTRFGAQLRAAVDDRRVARGLGVNVGLVFAVAFGVGCALAGLGGALAVGIVSIDPTFPIKYMIYFLIVIAVGGTATISGPFYASILLGLCDVAAHYFIPAVGSFVIYTVMVVALVTRPQGLFSRGRSR